MAISFVAFTDGNCSSVVVVSEFAIAKTAIKQKANTRIKSREIAARDIYYTAFPKSTVFTHVIKKLIHAPMIIKTKIPYSVGATYCTAANNAG